MFFFPTLPIQSPFKHSDGIILNSDIDLLQAKANARLAKVEKEFKSTIIVSENNTFVLPSSSTATKRSSKKPKRFTNDEAADDPEMEPIKPKRKRLAEKVVTYHPVSDKRRFNVIRSLQHVRVNVKQLPELYVEPWCLVHCLYKCNCKGRAQRGRIFNFSNKKNDLMAQGSWDTISPRKRQYTFDRDIVVDDEPIIKTRKVFKEPVETTTFCPTMFAARTTAFNWQGRSRRSTQELKTLRNECKFSENQQANLLNQRIMMCRKYNQARNMLTKSIENGRFGTKLRTPNGQIHVTEKPSSASLDRLNHVISDTMHRLTAMQERNQLALSNTPNKLSIVSWERMLQAFNAHEVFIWDVRLENNNRLLILTKIRTKPSSAEFVEVTNINYTEDVNALPLLAKMMRINYLSDKTKYLGESTYLSVIVT